MAITGIAIFRLGMDFGSLRSEKLERERRAEIEREPESAFDGGELERKTSCDVLTEYQEEIIEKLVTTNRDRAKSDYFQLV